MNLETYQSIKIIESFIKEDSIAFMIVQDAIEFSNYEKQMKEKIENEINKEKDRNKLLKYIQLCSISTENMANDNKAIKFVVNNFSKFNKLPKPKQTYILDKLLLSSSRDSLYPFNVLI